MTHELRMVALLVVLLAMAPLRAAWPQEKNAKADPPKTSTPIPGAVDRVNLGVTSITGNRELPKVLYIVPWKKSGPEDAVVRLSGNWLDQVLEPVDPDVFLRKLGYHEQLFDRVNGLNGKK